nr:non-canonical purine NTP pyrophosphatase [Lacticaseibacillus paracasei]
MVLAMIHSFCSSVRKTMAEMTAEEKNQISHRGNAMRALEDVWQTWLEANG